MMSEKVFPIVAESVEAAIDPNNKLTFLLDWELTLKCNLDCSYCGDCHDNSTAHPPLEECLQTIDFMFNYVDLYMEHKSPWSRHVILNVYGGESLYHPDIVGILEKVREKYQQYSSRWTLTVTTTTNAIVPKSRMKLIADLIDEFTVSYHTENLPKQKEQFINNLLLLKEQQKRFKCVILMHPNQSNFDDAMSMIDFCKENDIKYLARQLDRHYSPNKEWDYSTKQIQWFDNYYQSKNHSSTKTTSLGDKSLHLTDVGRACCGGRQLSINQNYKDRVYYASNKFPDWYCSVNWFFVYIRQVTREIFVNKDCKMNFNGSVGPIATLNNTDQLLQETQIRLTNKTMPTIQCAKTMCWCGLCAPKSKSLKTYNKIMEKYKL